jgi:hypothetical protein
MTEEPTLTAAEKRAAEKQAREASLGHPLFPTEPGEKPVAIAWIQLRRYGEQGPVDHQRVWPASEIQGQETIYQLFGGGVYEIWGRAPLPNGLPGSIVKKRHLTLDGPSRPFGGTAAQAASFAAPTVASPSGGGGDRMDVFLHMMADDRREARARAERQEAEARAAEERRQARDEERSRQMTTLLVNALTIGAGIVTTILNRPPPPPAEKGPDLMPLLAQLIPKPDAADPLDKLGKVLEIAEKVHPKKGATESLPELLAGFGHAMEGIAQVEHTRIQAAEKGLVPVGMPMATMQGSAPPQGAAAPPLSPVVNGTHPPRPTDRAPPPIMEEEPADDPARLVS